MLLQSQIFPQTIFVLDNGGILRLRDDCAKKTNQKNKKKI